MKKRVLLIDGYNMMHRARSGWVKGENPIVFNFFRSLRATVDKFKPDVVYFILEGRPVQRLETMSDYKGNREHHDRDDFIRQRKLIVSLLKDKFPVHVVRHPHYECDDVLAALARVTHASDDVIVVSSDTDFYQLLNGTQHIELYNPIKKDFIDPPKYDYVTWKALRGDSSDNIPGIRGIGDKRALDLIESDDVLQKFLEQKNHREVFQRNVEMIKFHDLSQSEMVELERSAPATDWLGLKQIFEDMKFFAITNIKSWSKFISTFDRLSPSMDMHMESPASMEELSA
jgi:DNA polymerase-1